MRRVIIFSLALVASALGDNSLPPSRQSAAWAITGPPGGIPAVSTVYTSFTSSASAANINTGINNCPTGQVVSLGSGTYTINNDMTIAKNGVVVRGATNASGFPTTILNGAAVKMHKTTWPDPSVDAIASINIVSGYSGGSTSITLASSAGADFAVGDLFAIDQTDDGTLVRTTVGLGGYTRNGRNYISLHRCLTKSGTVLTCEPPLAGTYLNTGQDPEAWGWSSYLGPTLLGAGLEDVKLAGGSSYYMIEAGPSDACWIKNVWISVGSSSAGSARIRAPYCCRIAITETIIDNIDPASSSAYGIYPTVFSWGEITHNVCTNSGLFLPSIAMVGTFIGYNVGLGPFPYGGSPATWLSEYMFPHGGHDHDNLIEGNWLGSTFDADGIYSGNSGNSALIRNRIVGWESGKTGNRIPITMEATGMINYTCLGNVLGAPEYHTSYSQIFGVDASTVGLIRTNNYNTVDGGVNSAETQVGGNVTSDSYKYPSRPAKWGDTECRWPPFGPESTQGTNALSYTNTPAGFRIYFGIGWPNGVAVGGGGSEHNVKRPVQNPVIIRRR